MTFTAIVFDLDGTLVDSAQGIEESLCEAIAAVAPERLSTARGIRSLVGPPIREMVRQMLPDLTGLELDKIVVDFRSRYNKHGWRAASLYEGVQETLSLLSTVPVRCFLVTNKPATPTRLMVKHFNLSRWLDDTVSPDTTSPPFESKAQALRHLCRKHKLSPCMSLYVGDSTEDSVAARAAGLPFAVASYGYGRANNSGALTADFCLRQISDLVPIMSGLSPSKAPGQPFNLVCRGEKL